jgi:hypothetical protein
MSKNRQQLKTGLRAILGGGIREESAASDVEDPAPKAEPLVPEPPKETLVVIVKPPPDTADEQHEDMPAAAAAHEEPARKQRKKMAPPPPPEPKPKMAPAVRVGTLDNPYVRKRDNMPTRKVGIVLPVALAERMQIHCVKARTRPNEFVARAIEALLDDLQA